MKITSVSMGIDHPLFCPFCGHATLTQSEITEKNVCEHLLFIANNEAGLDWCRPDLKNKLFKVDFNSSLSIARCKLVTNYTNGYDFDNTVIFEISEPYGMNGMGVYVGYEKRREEEKDMK